MIVFLYFFSNYINYLLIDLNYIYLYGGKSWYMNLYLLISILFVFMRMDYSVMWIKLNNMIMIFEKVIFDIWILGEIFSLNVL